MLFLCQYNDEPMTYYTVHITLIQYAELMIDAILESLRSVTSHSVDYDDGEIWQYTDWTRAGILDFTICSVFDDISINECPQYAADRGYAVQSEYFAVGTFGLIADKSLQKYKEYIMEIMMTESFKNKFESTMDNKLNERSNANQQRRLLQNNFEAVSVEIFDALDEADESQTDDATDPPTTTRIVVALCLVFVLLVVVIILAFVYCKKRKKQNEENNSIEMKVAVEMNENANVRQHVDLLDDISDQQIVTQDDDVLRSVNETSIGDVAGNFIIGDDEDGAVQSEQVHEDDEGNDTVAKNYKKVDVEEPSEHKKITAMMNDINKAYDDEQHSPFLIGIGVGDEPNEQYVLDAVNKTFENEEGGVSYP